VGEDIVMRGIDRVGVTGEEWSGADAAFGTSTSADAAVAIPPHSHPPGLIARFIEEWQEQNARVRRLTRLPENWDGDGSSPVNERTALFAIRMLAPLMCFVPAPSFSPGAHRDLWALWAAHGLDIELCFRRPGDVISMISDDKGAIEDFEDDDPHLTVTYAALQELGRRAAEYEISAQEGVTKSSRFAPAPLEDEVRGLATTSAERLLLAA
jgi:hypothetical protein